MTMAMIRGDNEKVVEEQLGDLMHFINRVLCHCILHSILYILRCHVQMTVRFNPFTVKRLVRFELSYSDFELVLDCLRTERLANDC